VNCRPTQHDEASGLAGELIGRERIAPILLSKVPYCSLVEFPMTDRQLALEAMSEAQRILEEYLEPRPHDNERLLDRLVEVLARPELIVAVDRLQHGNDW
jgi:hypothetical protein